MTDTALATAHRLLDQAADAVCPLAEAGADDELISLLTLCEAVTRRLDRAVVAAVSGLERRGVFAARGYRSSTAALVDLLGWERFEARQRVVAAGQVTPRVGLDGAVLPARLPATAEVFAAGRAGLRHVEAVERVLRTPAAQRLSPDQRAGVEEQLAAEAGDYTPPELPTWGGALVEVLDQDGAEPDDRPPVQVNELTVLRFRDGGGRLSGHFDDAAMFDAIATSIDAKAEPLTGGDERPGGQRQAEALAEAADAVLRRDRGADRDERPGTATGRRPRTPNRSGRIAPCRRGPGQGLCASGVRPAAILDGDPPRRAAGGRRCDETVESGNGV